MSTQPTSSLALGSVAWLRAQADEKEEMAHAMPAATPAFQREDQREILGLRDAATKIENLRSSLQAILDAVDYTAGNCRPNAMVGATLDRVLITNARETLKP